MQGGEKVAAEALPQGGCGTGNKTHGAKLGESPLLWVMFEADSAAILTLLLNTGKAFRRLAESQI